MKGTTVLKVKEAKQQLEKTEALVGLRASIQELLESASCEGYDAQTVRCVINEVLQEESPSKKTQKKANISMASSSKQLNTSTLHQMSIAELYSTYIDSQVLYPPKKPKKHDVRYLVISIQSEFGRNSSNTRSFSRTRRDTLKASTIPGPGYYNVEPIRVKTKAPAYATDRAPKGLRFSIPSTPGPGTYVSNKVFVTKS